MRITKEEGRMKYAVKVTRLNTSKLSEVQLFFQDCGSIRQCQLNNGEATIEFSSYREVKQALALGNRDFKGRKIKVSTVRLSEKDRLAIKFDVESLSVENDDSDFMRLLIGSLKSYHLGSNWFKNPDIRYLQIEELVRVIKFVRESKAHDYLLYIVKQVVSDIVLERNFFNSGLQKRLASFLDATNKLPATTQKSHEFDVGNNWINELNVAVSRIKELTDENKSLKQTIAMLRNRLVQSAVSQHQSADDMSSANRLTI